MKVKSENEVAQSCPILCNPMDYSLPGSSVFGIFQTRVLEWIAISFSRGSSWPRYRTPVSRICGQMLYHLSHREDDKTYDKLGVRAVLVPLTYSTCGDPWSCCVPSSRGRSGAAKGNKGWFPWWLGFPGSSDCKGYTCNAGDPGSIPGSGISPAEGIGYPLQYSWASLVAHLVKNLPAMWAGDLGLIPGLGRSPEEGNGYPLQYSGLENFMELIVHGIAKSRKWLSDFHFPLVATQPLDLARLTKHTSLRPHSSPCGFPELRSHRARSWNVLPWHAGQHSLVCSLTDQTHGPCLSVLHGPASPGG